MKKISLSIIIAVNLLSVNVDAGMWQNTKEYTNKAMFWKSKHLKDIDFKHIYPKPLYQKSYFGFAITGTAIVVAGAFSYFTAGAGAPVAATGVGATASWVGGGSYMAGLSTVGGWFGGNAMLGSAILNGMSVGIAGGTITKGATFATMSILSKAGIMASVTAAGLDGVFYWSNPDTKEMEYKVRVTIPENLGSKKTRDLVDKLNETKKQIADAVEEKDTNLQKGLYLAIEGYNKEATKLLKDALNANDDQEDLLVLGIMAWNNNEIGLFNKAISKIDKTNLNNIGFLSYLYALQELSKGNSEQSLINLQNSIDENNYAIEPILLSVNILGNDNFIQNEDQILKLVKNAQDNFDSDKYASNFGLTPLYYRVGTFYFTNKRYVKAEQFYRTAKEEMSILQRNFFSKQLVHTIDIGIANALYKQGKTKKANKVYNSILSDIDECEEKKQIVAQYLGD